MDSLVTIRLLDQFDPCVDAVRRMNYGDEPVSTSMRDAFDVAPSLYLVAFFEGEAVGSVRLCAGPNSPMHTWIEHCPLEKGAHVVDFNRAVVAKAFRKNGLCRLMLAEVTIAAHRFGFKHAIAAVDADSVLKRLFSDVGFARVGDRARAKHGNFEGFVQPLETPVAAVQSTAHVQFGIAVDQMRAGGYVVRSLVPSDLDAILRKRSGLPRAAPERDQVFAHRELERGVAAVQQLSFKQSSAKWLPFPPEPQRWRDQKLGRHLIDCAAILAAITPVYAMVETFLLDMDFGVVLSSRLLMALVVILGLGSVIARLRDVSLRYWAPRLGVLTGVRRRMHDLALTWCVNGLIAPVIYAISGATGTQILLGTLTALAIGAVSGPLTGWSIDTTRDLCGVAKASDVESGMPPLPPSPTWPTSRTPAPAAREHLAGVTLVGS